MVCIQTPTWRYFSFCRKETGILCHKKHAGFGSESQPGKSFENHQLDGRKDVVFCTNERIVARGIIQCKYCEAYARINST